MKYIFYLITVFCTTYLSAQTPADSAVAPKPVKRIVHPIIRKDSVVAVHNALRDSLFSQADSMASRLHMSEGERKRSFTYRDVLALNTYFNFFAQPQNLVAQERVEPDKDALFYLIMGMLLFFAFVKRIFNRYVTNLVGLIFRGSLRQKQIREQLLQAPLPSLFLNIFFVMVAGLYVYVLLQYYNIGLRIPFWLLILYCTVSIGIVYVVKFMILKLTGWIFNMRDAADTYIFIVFLVNKLLAIFLLPLVTILVFSVASWTSALLTLSYIMVLLFFAYRYIVSFAPVRREVKVSQFHFFMYLCAFEIVPLLLIYKVLIHYFSAT